MELFRLARIFFQVGALNEAQYRVNFVLQLFESLVALGTGLIALSLVFQHTTELAGWSQPELLAVMGVHVLVQGLIRTVIEPNMLRLAEDIQQGTLDYTLTKPADAQALISIREIRIWQTVNIALGLIVLITALVLIGDRFAPLQALIFGGALLCGSLIIYSFWLMLTTISFWVVRVESMLNLFDGFYAAGRWPVGIYPAWLRGLLTFLVPVAFAVTVPAETLVGRLDWASLALLGALTLGFLLISRLFFRIGLRNYAGASA